MDIITLAIGGAAGLLVVGSAVWYGLRRAHMSGNSQ